MNPSLDATPLIDILANPVAAENIFWLIFKLLFLVGFAIYIAFAVIVVKQVFMMTNTYQTGAEFILRLLAFVHLAMAIGAFFLAFLVL